MNEALLVGDINYWDFQDGTPLNADVTPEAVKNTLAQFRGISSRVEDYADTSLLEESKKEGLITELQQKYRR
jgi:hypothetical protein